MASLDLVVQCWTMGEILPDEMRGLRTAIANGTGFAGWHGGIVDSFRLATDYLQMVGGQFAAHPHDLVDHTIEIVPERADHPVVAGIDSISLHSEQYWVLADSYNDVLATTTILPRDGDPWHEPVVSPPCGRAAGAPDASSCARQATSSPTSRCRRSARSSSAASSGRAAEPARVTAFRGLLAYPITPLTDDDAPDLDALGRLVGTPPRRGSTASSCSRRRAPGSRSTRTSATPSCARPCPRVDGRHAGARPRRGERRVDARGPRAGPRGARRGRRRARPRAVLLPPARRGGGRRAVRGGRGGRRPAGVLLQPQRADRVRPLARRPRAPRPHDDRRRGQDAASTPARPQGRVAELRAATDGLRMSVGLSGDVPLVRGAEPADAWHTGLATLVPAEYVALRRARTAGTVPDARVAGWLHDLTDVLADLRPVSGFHALAALLGVPTAPHADRRSLSRPTASRGCARSSPGGPGLSRQTAASTAACRSSRPVVRSLGPRPKPHSVATPTGRSPSTAAAAASRRRAPRRRPRGAGGRGRARSPGRGAGPPAGRRTRRRRARSGRAGGPSRPAGRGAPAGRSRRARGSRCPSARRSASPRRRRSRGGTPAPPRRGRAARTPRPGARTLRRRPRLPRPRRRTTRAPRRHRGSPLDERELGREVDLDREVLRRDRGDDRRELADERGLVDGVHRRAVLGCDERRHRRERRGQAHLEAGPGGKRALLAESDEVGVRGEGGVRVAERAEPQVRRVDGTVEDVRAHVEPRDDDRVHRDAGEAVDGGEPLALEEDPVEPLADLPVGDAAHVVAEVHPTARKVSRAVDRFTEPTRWAPRRVGRVRDGAVVASSTGAS